MLIFLSETYTQYFSFLNLFNYLTFRTGGAILTSLFFSLIFGEMIIKYLSSKQPIGQPIRKDGPERHIFEKAGTPTMGGVLILLSIFFSVIIWANLSSAFIWITLFSCFAFGTIGFLDDYKKINSKKNNGMTALIKLILQILVGLIVIYLIYNFLPTSINSKINFPFLKNLIIDLGFFFFPFGVFLLIGSANAVNLTDGLDGLAIVPVMIVALSFGIISYLVGNIFFSEYLIIEYIPGSGELCIFCGSLVGSALGFLWFNAPPAKVFMGDTGSLSMGGTLGTIALITKHEIVLAIIGGLFVLETLSVVIQVISFRLTGKRIFRMAPLHHHFEKKGWAESTIVIRFWIITVVLALIGLATLKIR